MLPSSGGVSSRFPCRHGPRRRLVLRQVKDESGADAQGDAGGVGARGAGAVEAVSSGSPCAGLVRDRMLPSSGGGSSRFFPRVGPRRRLVLRQGTAESGAGSQGDAGGGVTRGVGAVEEVSSGSLGESVALEDLARQASAADSSLPVRGLFPAGVATMPGAVAAEADVSEISFR